MTHFNKDLQNPLPFLATYILLCESFFMNNLVGVGIITVENRNFLWDHAKQVYWHLVLPKNILLDYNN